MTRPPDHFASFDQLDVMSVGPPVVLAVGGLSIVFGLLDGLALTASSILCSIAIIRWGRSASEAGDATPPRSGIRLRRWGWIGLFVGGWIGYFLVPPPIGHLRGLWMGALVVPFGLRERPATLPEEGE
jgi:hypothetical protein